MTGEVSNGERDVKQYASSKTQNLTGEIWEVSWNLWAGNADSFTPKTPITDDTDSVQHQHVFLGWWIGLFVILHETYINLKQQCDSDWAVTLFYMAGSSHAYSWDL